MKLIIEGEMATLNEHDLANRTNRFMGAALKKRETERVYFACRQQKLSARLKKCNFTFTWFVKDKRKDPDNIHHAIKYIFDGLVQAGVLYGDTQEWIGKVTHNPIRIDAKRPRVEVEL